MRHSPVRQRRRIVDAELRETQTESASAIEPLQKLRTHIRESLEEAKV